MAITEYYSDIIYRAEAIKNAAGLTRRQWQRFKGEIPLQSRVITYANGKRYRVLAANRLLLALWGQEKFGVNR